MRKPGSYIWGSLLTILLLLTTFVGSASADVYRNFASLKAHEKLGVDYKVVKSYTDSRTIVIPIHGWTIERETDEIASAVASRGKFDYYGFRS